MIVGNKVNHFGAFHCIYCAGAIQFDYAQLLPYGHIHDICCPYCNKVNIIDIFGEGIYHRLYDPLDNAFT